MNEHKNNTIDLDFDIIPNSLNELDNRTYKLSNHEKNIIKQQKLKKKLNDDTEYMELKIEPTKKKKAITREKNL